MILSIYHTKYFFGLLSRCTQHVTTVVNIMKGSKPILDVQSQLEGAVWELRTKEQGRITHVSPWELIRDHPHAV